MFIVILKETLQGSLKDPQGLYEDPLRIFRGISKRTQHNVAGQDPNPDHSIRSRAL